MKLADRLTLPPCPECGAGGVFSKSVTHNHGCRGAQALDDLMDRDRAWFDDNLGEFEFTRPVEPGDFTVPAWGAADIIGTITVRWVAPDVRARSFDDVMIRFIPVDQLTMSDKYVIAHLRLASHTHEHPPAG